MTRDYVYDINIKSRVDQRGIIQWQYDGLQNRSRGFESLFPWFYRDNRKVVMDFIRGHFSIVIIAIVIIYLCMGLAYVQNSPSGAINIAHITASTIVGNILATLTLPGHTRFKPTQKIKTDPVIERYESAVSVMSGSKRPEQRVTLP